MNEIYLISMLAFTVISVILAFGFIDEWFGALGLIGVLFSLILFAISAVAPIGDTIVETTTGKNTRVGNEFIISSKFPTQIATHVGFDGQEEVVVKRITKKNAWGGDMIVTYKISTK